VFTGIDDSTSESSDSVEVWAYVKLESKIYILKIL
jgi:hypothetical protein